MADPVADSVASRDRATTPVVVPLRVLWLIKGLGPGGAEHLLVASAGARDREAFDVRCGYLLPWKDALVERMEAAGVPTRCLEVRDERDLRWAGRLRRWLRDDPVDVIHVHSPYVAALTRLVVATLPRRVRPVLVSTEHNAWTNFKGPTRWLNAATARLDAAKFAVSEETRESMSPRERARCETLVHGIDVAAVAAQRTEHAVVRAELGLDEQTVAVGTVANYHPKKDWPNLLAAARVVADRGLPVRFVSVGQGPLQAEVEARHAELGLDGVVTLTGHRPDAVRLMAGCDVFLLASRWEGLPVALMEAFALGLPIVSTAVGGIPDVVTDGVEGRLVGPGEPTALADAIEQLVRDPDARARMAAASAARAEEFDIARAQHRVEAVYRAVARR